MSRAGWAWVGLLAVLFAWVPVLVLVAVVGALQ